MTLLQTALAIACVLALAPVRAARAADEAKPAERPAVKKEEPKPAGKLKVLRLDEFTVEGRIQKPQAFFILQRSNLSFDDGEKKESFLPKIVKSCDKDPF